MDSKNISIFIFIVILFIGCATTINYEATDQALFSKAINSVVSSIDIPANLIVNIKLNLRIVGYKATNKELKELKEERIKNNLYGEGMLIEDKIVEYLRKSGANITEYDKSDYELVVMSEIAGEHRTQKSIMFIDYDKERAIKIKLHLYLYDKTGKKIIYSKDCSADSSINE